jgi:hypothetical protein
MKHEKVVDKKRKVGIMKNVMVDRVELCLKYWHRENNS